MQCLSTCSERPKNKENWKMNFLLSKFKPFVAVTRKPLVLSRISIIFSFNYLFWLFFLLFSWLLWSSSSVFCQDLVRKYFKSDVFRRYISKKILFVREINWIFTIAAKPFFLVEIITLKPLPQLKGLSYICINLVMWACLTKLYIFLRKSKPRRERLCPT